MVLHGLNRACICRWVHAYFAPNVLCARSSQLILSEWQAVGTLDCSYAGRAFEREEEAQSGEGEMICKGMRSMWRQVSCHITYN